MNFVRLAFARTAWIAGILVIFVASTSLAQTREKERKPAELQSDTQKTSPTDTENEDPQFKGMKYRLVGALRGGGGVTASRLGCGSQTLFFCFACGGSV